MDKELGGIGWVTSPTRRLGRWFRTKRKLLPVTRELGGELGHLLQALCPGHRVLGISLSSCVSVSLSSLARGQEPPAWCCQRGLPGLSSVSPTACSERQATPSFIVFPLGIPDIQDRGCDLGW